MEFDTRGEKKELRTLKESTVLPLSLTYFQKLLNISFGRFLLIFQRLIRKVGKENLIQVINWGSLSFCLYGTGVTAPSPETRMCKWGHTDPPGLEDTCRNRWCQAQVLPSGERELAEFQPLEVRWRGKWSPISRSLYKGVQNTSSALQLKFHCVLCRYGKPALA